MIMKEIDVGHLKNMDESEVFLNKEITSRI